MIKTKKCHAGYTLSPSAFGESLGRELPETRLGKCDSLHSCQELSILARDTRRQPGETRDPLACAHGPLKKWDLNKARHERRGYMRGSKARRMFPSILSFSPCLGFPRRECTAGIRGPMLHSVQLLDCVNVQDVPNWKLQFWRNYWQSNLCKKIMFKNATVEKICHFQYSQLCV